MLTLDCEEKNICVFTLLWDSLSPFPDGNKLISYYELSRKCPVAHDRHQGIGDRNRNPSAGCGYVQKTFPG